MTNADDDLAPAFRRLRAAAEAAKLPGVEEGTWYGTPALKVRGKSFVRVKDAGTVVVLCPIEEKEMLIAADPGIFYETDHYRGWPAMLVRIAAIDDAALAHRLERSWRQRAPKRLVAEFEALRAATAG